MNAVHLCMLHNDLVINFKCLERDNIKGRFILLLLRMRSVHLKMVRESPVF